MSMIAALISVLMLVPVGSAVAQDHRSPDAKPVLITRDLSSPDARSASLTQTPSVAPAAGRPGYVDIQDHGSPAAAGSSGSTVPSVPAAADESSDSFNWGFLAIIIAIPLILLVAFVLTQRRARHGMAVGS